MYLLLRCQQPHYSISAANIFAGFRHEAVRHLQLFVALFYSGTKDDKMITCPQKYIPIFTKGIACSTTAGHLTLCHMHLKFIPVVAILFLTISFANGQDTAKRPAPVPKKMIQYGIASFYSDKFQGRKTASGEIFSQKKLTAAHNTLPLGTYIRVTNLRNRKSVVVRVNDRLHHRNKRLVDLSRAAANKIGFIKAGTTRVRVEVLGKNPPAER